MKHKVKIGIVGLSEIAIRQHLPALFKMIEVEVIGAFDPDISKFDKANSALGTNIKFFNSYQDICFAADALIICSPESVLASQVEIAVNEYGLSVMVEDSAATNADKLEERYHSVFDAGNFKVLFFYEDAEELIRNGAYDSFIEDVTRYL